jgi:hypothetical protein
MKTQINTNKFKTLKISVWLVNKGNFNDERLIANKTIPLSELKEKGLVSVQGRCKATAQLVEYLNR